MMYLKNIIAAVFLLFGVAPSYSQLSSLEIDQLAETTISTFNVAGMAIGVVKDGKIIHSKGYGMKSIINSSDEFGFSPVEAISYSIMDSYLGLEDNQWIDKMDQHFQRFRQQSDSVSTAVWQTVDSASSETLEPQDYIGIYEDPWFGKVEIFIRNEDLWFKSFRSPKLNGKMEFYKANAFAIRWEYQEMNADAFAIFGLDEEGRAQTIQMKGISPNIDFSFDFQDLNFKRVE